MPHELVVGHAELAELRLRSAPDGHRLGRPAVGLLRIEQKLVHGFDDGHQQAGSGERRFEW